MYRKFAIVAGIVGMSMASVAGVAFAAQVSFTGTAIGGEPTQLKEQQYQVMAEPGAQLEIILSQTPAEGVGCLSNDHFFMAAFEGGHSLENRSAPGGNCRHTLAYRSVNGPVTLVVGNSSGKTVEYSIVADGASTPTPVVEPKTTQTAPKDPGTGF